jgi:hypothetical protein
MRPAPAHGVRGNCLPARSTLREASSEQMPKMEERPGDAVRRGLKKKAALPAKNADGRRVEDSVVLAAAEVRLPPAAYRVADVRANIV